MTLHTPDKIPFAGGGEALAPGPAAADVIVLAIMHPPVGDLNRFAQSPGLQSISQSVGQHVLPHQSSLSLDRISSPEIAVSIVGELIRVRAGRP